MRLIASNCLLIILLAVATSSCASAGQVERTLTPTSLRSSAETFDGKVVTITAWITLDPEDANLWSSERDMDTSRTIHCVSLENFDPFWERRHEINRHRVEVTGMFHKDVVLDSGTVRFAACSKSAIEPASIRLLD